MIEVEIKGKCLSCDETSNDDQLHVYCSNCSNELYKLEDIEYAIESITTNDYHWTDREFYVGFKDEEEKDLFLRGIKKGFSDALFHLCDYFGTMHIFDDFCKKYYKEKE
ncbi:MAG TPA: hypothetical protein VGJ00_10305 [Rhabdochlamydiaceae bacterium]|jgi:hypothetical protein